MKTLYFRIARRIHFFFFGKELECASPQMKKAKPSRVMFKQQTLSNMSTNDVEKIF